MKKLNEIVSNFMSSKAGKVSAVIAGLTPVVGMTAGYCEVGDPVITLTSTMFAPITDTISANLGTLVGVGVALMAINISVSYIPKIVYKFF